MCLSSDKKHEGRPISFQGKKTTFLSGKKTFFSIRRAYVKRINRQWKSMFIITYMQTNPKVIENKIMRRNWCIGQLTDTEGSS